MKVLVTGAGGQLGVTICRTFASRHEVVAVTKAELDVTSHARVIDTVLDLQPAAIVNCAAYNDVDSAEDDPVHAMRVNTFGVRSLVLAARDVGATLVHYGTDFVFDGTATRPYIEEDSPNPQSVYAVSKLLGEWFARDAPQYYVLRVESLFGGAAIESDVSRGVRGGTLDRMANAMLDGRQVRAFVDRTVSPSYSDDVAEATAGILAANPPPGLYHCVSSGLATWFEVAVELAGHLGCDVPLERVRMDDVRLPARRPRFCALSNGKLATAGIRMPTWQDAIARYAAARLQAVVRH